MLGDQAGCCYCSNPCERGWGPRLKLQCLHTSICPGKYVCYFSINIIIMFLLSLSSFPVWMINLQDHNGDAKEYSSWFLQFLTALKLYNPFLSKILALHIFRGKNLFGNPRKAVVEQCMSFGLNKSACFLVALRLVSSCKFLHAN